MSLDPPPEHKPPPDEGPEHRELWARGEVPVRESEGDPGAPVEYTIRTGLDTISYDDSLGQLVFFCEENFGPKAEREISLCDKVAERGDPIRYEIAAQRAAKHLRSKDYVPRIFDPTLLDWEALRAAQERYKAKLISEGQMIEYEIPAPSPASKLETQDVPPPSWFKRIIQWLRKP